jgi:hypothetical protein
MTPLDEWANGNNRADTRVALTRTMKIIILPRRVMGKEAQFYFDPGKT